MGEGFGMFWDAWDNIEQYIQYITIYNNIQQYITIENIIKHYNTKKMCEDN
jgi:hypothetical protein